MFVIVTVWNPGYVSYIAGTIRVVSYVCNRDCVESRSIIYNLSYPGRVRCLLLWLWNPGVSYITGAIQVVSGVCYCDCVESRSVIYITWAIRAVSDVCCRVCVWSSRQTFSFFAKDYQCSFMGPCRYSDRSIVWQVVCPTSRYSDKQVNIPTCLYSDGSIFWQIVSPTGG